MLGGSVYIAFIRLAINLAGIILLYSRISEFRFPRKKTILYYGVFCMAMEVFASVWYAADWAGYVRMGPFTVYVCFAGFSAWIGRDSFYLAVYKLALGFYLMAVYVIGGLEISVLFFNSNIWADMAARVLIICLLAWWLDKYVKKSIREFGTYIEKEADRFSVAVMIISILLGIGYILNPDLNRDMTFARIYQIAINIILTGTLQLLIFHFYCHVGNEKKYERENQMMQMNYRLLERQIEILEESAESGRRIRHDIRHHNAVIAECARRGQKEELLAYLKEYEEETDQGIPQRICANAAVNNILSAYTRKARSEGIEVSLDVEIGKNLPVLSVDLVAILANAYENAIYACMEMKKRQDERKPFIHLMIKKRNKKLVISCSNTCRPEMELKDGQPKTEFTGGIGVSSIIRVAEKYGGEYDFQNDGGVFQFRLVMNTEPPDKLADDFSWMGVKLHDGTDCAL